MTLADAKEIKQNEENNLLDFRLCGTQITLQSRPGPSCSRPSSRIDSAFRAMSATPTLSYQEKHRKTPPWTRPQSADHITRGSHRRKLAPKFDRNGERRHSKRKGTGSMNNLLESSSIEDGLDSETSVTGSPVPSLTDVLRSSNKLEPGLAGKPPLPPPPGLTSRREHRSLDDIINIKFQRWFPEAIQDTYSDTVAQLTGDHKPLSNGHATPHIKVSKSSENLSDLRNSSGTPETQVMLNYPMQFDAYESPRMDPGKKLPRSHTMETILESEDSIAQDRIQKNSSPGKFSDQKVNYNSNDSNDFLKSQIGQSLNKYFSDSDHSNQKKKVTIHEKSGSEAAPHPHDGSPTAQVVESSNRDAAGGGREPSPSAGDYRESGQESFQPQLNGNPPWTGLNNEDILSWMGNSAMNSSQEKAFGSTYNDILKMLKVLEKEEVESLKLEALSVNRSNNNSVCSNITPAGTSCRDILTFLDDLDRSDSRNEAPHPEIKNVVINSEVSKAVGGRMGQLLSLDQAELAQRVMALSLELEGKAVECERAQTQLADASDKLLKHKSQSDSIIKRHQTFIDQLLQEKRLLGEQCASIVKEMEEKNTKTVASMESRHEVEMKKLQEKMLAAEKIRREKWENERIKKIKEQTVKGLEPELERLTRAHADELSELRRAHDRELTEMEAACSRRISAAREQALRDREQAVQEEREAARNKLDCELAEVERSYQEQRRRLLAEVRDEKERLEREAQASLAVRTRQLEEKWAQAEAQLQETLAESQEKHQRDLKSIQDALQRDQNSWLNHQANALAVKEKQMRDILKKERDRHIEAVIRRLDHEMQDKEKALEAKMQKMKEEYERELKESEEALHEIKRKLKESRSEVQEYEEMASKLRSQVTQLDCQLTTSKQQMERLEFERSESQSLVRSEACSQIAALQRELTEERMKREELIASLQSEKERELQQVYNRFMQQEILTTALRKSSIEMASEFERVKEAISKKEETVRLVGKQRDAALEQCAQLENMLEQQRKELALRK